MFFASSSQFFAFSILLINPSIYIFFFLSFIYGMGGWEDIYSARVRTQ
jgi:hypothetical protein